MPSASVHDTKSRFGGLHNNNRDFGRNNGVYSKKPAPTPPVMKHKKGQAPQPTGNDWQPALKPVSPRKVDPIKEMKMIGQKRDDDVIFLHLICFSKRFQLNAHLRELRTILHSTSKIC